MNCKEFETLINDLARSQVMDAARRQTALAHSKACARCDGRLVEEKQLTVGLRALAILDENQKASASAEANLLSAFRKNAEVARQPIAAPAALSSVLSPQSRIKGWSIAAAAVILLMLALLALRIQNASPDLKAVEQNAGSPAPTQPEPPPGNKENTPVLPEQVATQGKTVAPVARPNAKKAQTNKGSAKDLSRLNPQIATNETNGGAQTTQEQSAQGEIATPYMSLTQGYTLPMSEGGQVVRVELPHSALASFGLPVNAERLNERVKADVVVGHDGIARAIRFVR